MYKNNESKWISVDDRLPALNLKHKDAYRSMEVFCLCRGERDSWVAVGYLILAGKNEGWWQTRDGGGRRSIIINGVTHWMPLPDLEV